MPDIERYDMLVLGSGEAGKYLAWHLAGAGQRVAVVERRLIGGSCPNTNCLPSKNEIRSAAVAHLVRHAEAFGTIVGGAKLDMAKVLARKRAMVDGLVAMHLERFRTSGAELVMGAGRFVAPRTLEVALNDGGTRRLAAGRVVIDVGTHAAIPGVPGLAGAAPLTAVEALELDRVPEHLLVIGGGYVGMEMAQAFRRFGSRVTLVEPGPQIARREDPDAAAALLALLRDEGVDVYLDARPVEVEGRSGHAVHVRLHTPGGDPVVPASDILVAAGRMPNTQGIGLDLAGVALDAHGFVQVDDRLQTTAPGVWAVGECAGSPQFTHASYDDFRIVRDNLAGRSRSTRGRLVPSCLFTDPPFARVGLSEAEARARGIAVRVARLPLAAVLRTRTTGETRGFMKALVEAEGERILGFAMLGAEAGEVMAAVQTAMLAGLPYGGLRDAVLAHPTMAEGLGQLFAAVPAR
ncbi:MAG: FAD-dependent oxidoreductase [Dongiaceae bacterium]